MPNTSYNQFGTGRSLSTSHNPLVQHGINGADMLLNRSDEPPESQNGCARVTPILSQRFGLHFNRRFTMPHGAPYPLRPSPERRPSGVSECFSGLEVPQKPPRPYKPYIPRKSRKQFQFPKIVATVPPPLPTPPPPPPPQSVPPQPQPTTSEQTVPLTSEGSSNCSTAPPAARNQQVLTGNEERVDTALAAKTMDIDEFKKKFPHGTSVRDILTSGWYKDQATGKYYMENEPPPRNEEQLEDTTTSTSDRSPQESGSSEANQEQQVMPVVNSKSNWRQSTRGRPVTRGRGNSHLPHQIHYMPSQSHSIPRNAQQQHLLPVKIQQEPVYHPSHRNHPHNLMPPVSHAMAMSMQNHLMHVPGQGMVQFPLLHAQQMQQHLQQQLQHQMQHHLQLQIQRQKISQQQFMQRQQLPQSPQMKPNLTNMQQSYDHTQHMPQQQGSPQQSPNNLLQTPAISGTTTDSRSQSLPPPSKQSANAAAQPEVTRLGEKTQLDSAGRKPITPTKPNILRKNQSSDDTTTQLPSCDTPSIEISPATALPISSNQISVLIPAENMRQVAVQEVPSEAPPRKRERKQVFEPDGPYQLSQLYSLIQEETQTADTIGSTIETVANPSFQFFPGVESFDHKIRQMITKAPRMEPTKNLAIDSGRVSEVEKMQVSNISSVKLPNIESVTSGVKSELLNFNQLAMNIKQEILDTENPSPPKKVRGRPRKNQVPAQVQVPVSLQDQVQEALLLLQQQLMFPTEQSPQLPPPSPPAPPKPKQHRKPSTPKQPKDTSSKPGAKKKSKKIKQEEEDEETSEKERLALLQALPTNLLNAIEAQKVVDAQEQERDKEKESYKEKSKKTPRKYTKRANKPSNLFEEADFAGNRVFLQSMAHMDASGLFSGVNPHTGEQIHPTSETIAGMLPISILSHHEDPPIKEIDDELPPPPIATAVATSGTPLTLNIYEYPPKFVAAPVWTDDTGPLVPIFMYQNDKKIERQNNHTDDEENEAANIDQVNRDETQEEVPYVPKVITKAALKFVPPIAKKRGPRKLKVVFAETPFEPPAPWKPMENALRRVAPKLPRKLLKNSVHIIPKTIDFCQPIAKVKLAKKRSSEKTRKWLKMNQGVQIVQLLKYFKKHLITFDKMLFDEKEAPSLLKIMMETIIEEEKNIYSEKINDVLDEVVDDCCDACFEESTGRVTSHSTNVLNFRVDRTGLDSTSRWKAWNTKVTQRINQQTKSEMVDSRLTTIDTYSGLFSNKIRKILHPKLRKEAIQICRDIMKLRSRLEIGSGSRPRKGTTLEPKTICHLKLNALEMRSATYVARKNEHRNCQLAEMITTWEKAAKKFDTSKTVQEKVDAHEIIAKCTKSLTCSLDLHDAYIDVCMFVARLQVLYYHACQLHENFDKETKELKEVYLSIEDTEHLLILSEAKVKLLSECRKQSRIDLITTYIEGDAMNVEKDRLKRLQESDADAESIAMSEEKLKAKKAQFVRSCEDIGLEKVMKQYLKATSKEKSKEKLKIEDAKSMPIRKNVFHLCNDGGYVYSREIAPKFLSNECRALSLMQMAITHSLPTNIVDEKFRSFADAEKREAKKIVISMVQQCRMELYSFDQRRQCLNMEASQLKYERLKEDQETDFGQTDQQMMRSIREKVFQLGEAVKENQLAVFNPSTHDQEELDLKVQESIKAFQKKKREQAFKRRYLADYLSDTTLGWETHDVNKQKIMRIEQYRKRRDDIEQSQEIVCGHMETQMKKNPANPFYAEYEKLCTEEVTSFETETDDIGPLVNSIKELSSHIRMAETEEIRKKYQELLDMQKTTYQALQQKKRADRRDMLRNNEKNAKRWSQIDLNFREILNELEFYSGHEIDQLEKNDVSILDTTFITQNHSGKSYFQKR
ncbi:hypothetical protein L3Y34_010224 [Caenorhabditis briggsae]|uniref:CARD domain-containing protein n=1 Tax=Caenorhabditis briggsae TaxID=6238 RepID=A0AAE9CSS0_CAEBR|nr:hypothetical protein L3Y34_010224 [Caenorhabditis briggsae]